MNIDSKNHQRKVQRKLKRLQHIVANDSGVTCCDEPTQNLVICNAGLSTGLDQAAIVSEFSKFGALSDICLLRGKSYCFVVCEGEISAMNIYKEAHGKCFLGQNDTPIYLSFCMNVPDDHSVQQYLPPGLMILENFITPAEEEMFSNIIKWTGNNEQSNSILKHRQVKHFGYEFQYDTNNIDSDKPLNEKIPEECDFLWKKLNDRQIIGKIIEPPHQLTVNKYEPGQGIPSHVDTHSAFAEPIISLSLFSDIVMEFRKPTKNNSKEYTAQISVPLPRRSMLIMSGESRYGWKHGITPKKIDVVQNADGHLTTKYRTQRISYTFRWLSTGLCDCEFHSLCDTHRKKNFNEKKTNLLEHPSQCELENVHKVYNEIANHFSETRHSPWPQVNEFIQQFENGSVLVDIGCGNGKYLQSNRNIFEIGCDRSEGLLSVCSERRLNIFQCDCLAVPIRSNSVDGCISIAVIHHLASEDRRIRAIKEMIRILRKNGRGLIYVWAKNQSLQSKSCYLRQNKRNNRKSVEKTDTNDIADNTMDEQQIDDSNKNNNLSLPIHANRTEFEHTDILVPWKLKNSKTIVKNGKCDQQPNIFLRYYHVFEENELERLCGQFTNISVEKNYYDQGNWCIIFQKISE